jgi:hypothetical protein
MNTKPRAHRQFRHLPVFIAMILGAATLNVPAQAQHFYDHDRQWKSGGMADNGTVPDDYLVPMPVGDITRSTPPMGYRVSKQQMRMQQAQAAQSAQMAQMEMQGDFYAPVMNYSGRSGRGYSVKRNATARGAKDDTKDWLNGMGGTAWGTFTVTPDDRSRAKAQAARRRMQAAQAQAQAEADAPLHAGFADSGGLIRGGSGSAYRMNGRGQF